MKIKEMENKLCEKNLLKIYDRGSWKEYIGLKVSYKTICNWSQKLAFCW